MVVSVNEHPLRLSPEQPDQNSQLVGHLPWDLAFCWLLWLGLRGGWGGARPRTADAMDLASHGAPSSLPAFAIPDKRRRLRMPAPRRLFKPAADFGRAVGMLSSQRPALEHALDGFGHGEPAAAHGRVERHDAVRAQHQLGCLVAGEIVP